MFDEMAAAAPLPNATDGLNSDGFVSKLVLLELPTAVGDGVNENGPDGTGSTPISPDVIELILSRGCRKTNGR